MTKEEQARLFKHFEEKDFEEIIDFCTPKIELDKTNHLYWGARGAAHFELFNLDNAVFDLTQAIELNPDYAIGFYNRGRSYAEMGKFELAIADLEKTKSINKTLVANDIYLGVCYSEIRNYDKGIEYYTSYLLENSKDKEVLQWRAELYYLTNQNEKASRDIAELLSTDIESIAFIEKLNEVRKSDSSNNYSIQKPLAFREGQIFVFHAICF